MASSDARERLTDAATRIASERGFQGIEAAQVARAAGLSTEDFYAQFDTVEQCLLAAFDHFLRRLVEHVEEACEEAETWPDKVKTTIGAAFDFVTELEPVARVFAADAMHTGPAGIERKYASIESAARCLKQGRELYPGAANLPEAMERMLVAGVVMLATTYLLSEEAGRLAGVETEAVEMVLAPYLGIEQARSLAAA